MSSRRAFLQQASAAAFPLIVGRFTTGVQARASMLTGTVAIGLFFDDEDLPTLRERFSSDPLFGSFRETLQAFDREEARQFISSEVRYNDHLYDIARLYNIAPDMAFYFAMTGDEDAADLAAEAVRAIMRFPKWDYFLEGGRTFGLQRAPGSTVAVACAADWLGAFITEDERREWVRVMGERGCEPSFLGIYGMRYPDRVQGWGFDRESTYLEHRPYDTALDFSNWPYILDRTNLKAVPASALAIGATAYEAVLGPTDDTTRWIEQAAFSVQSFEHLFARDGSYDEGLSYANYTALHLAQATDVFRRFGHAELFDVINWNGFVEYGIEMSLPTADDPFDIVNFCDAGRGLQSAVPFWVADRTGDRHAQWFGAEQTEAHNAWSLIWYAPSIEREHPDPRPHIWLSDLDWLVARNGYGPDDLVVAMRSGPPSNHEHADRNSLIVKCFGERLVTDPYRPPYPPADPSWLLRTTEGHSALLIDGKGHQYHDGSEGTNAADAAAHIVRTLERPGFALWASDASQGYALVHPGLESVTRTVLVLYDLPAVVVLDKVLHAEPVRIQARYFARNEDGKGTVEAGGEAFQVVRPHAAMRALGFSPLGAAAEAGTLPIDPERAPTHPFVDVGTLESDTAPSLITVLLPTRDSDTHATAEVTAEDAGFSVALRNGNHSAGLRVLDTGWIPEVIVTAI